VADQRRVGFAPPEAIEFGRPDGGQGDTLDALITARLGGADEAELLALLGHGEEAAPPSRLTLSGDPTLLALLAEACARMDGVSCLEGDAAFGWVVDPKKEIAPSKSHVRAVKAWRGTDPDKGWRYQSIEPGSRGKGKAAAPTGEEKPPRETPAWRQPGRESVADLAAHLASLTPDDLDARTVTDLAESLAKDFRRDELRELGRLMRENAGPNGGLFRVGAKEKSQLALDIVEAARRAGATPPTAPEVPPAAAETPPADPAARLAASLPVAEPDERYGAVVSLARLREASGLPREDFDRAVLDLIASREWVGHTDPSAETMYVTDAERAAMVQDGKGHYFVAIGRRNPEPYPLEGDTPETPPASTPPTPGGGGSSAPPAPAAPSLPPSDLASVRKYASLAGLALTPADEATIARDAAARATAERRSLQSEHVMAAYDEWRRGQEPVTLPDRFSTLDARNAVAKVAQRVRGGDPEAVANLKELVDLVERRKGAMAVREIAGDFGVSTQSPRNPMDVATTLEIRDRIIS
jgi:hypothetical protein